ncbi:hypothetical protein DKX38_004353 [Salix brachista]|uniref:Uncharacterized protein n=1 Tax=Salix brachista TaxID=2182728 RepID=A0A5N5NAJ4_9ROSI|nr:hypothetical protein DKX38_004353 [Salix brachista]
MVSTENPFAEERSTDQNTAQKRKRSGRVQSNMKRLRAEMAEIGEQQKRIREGQMEMRESVQEIECEYDQLRKETLLISKQAARYQRSLNEMFEIVIARENSNLSEADGLIQCLRLVSPPHSLSTITDRLIILLISFDRLCLLYKCREEGKHEE